VSDTAIIRIEQLYPFSIEQIDTIIKSYPNAAKFKWVQEEPENMGAWSYLLRIWNKIELKLVSRRESASPATGSHAQHEKEQIEIVKKAFE
jgi:2-oxoglutarate dehydrogenase E1 component